MLNENGQFLFGSDYLILKQMNYDLTEARPDRIVGSAGPFDFSGCLTPAAVPITIKIDGNAPVAATIDITGTADPAAVTVAELVVLLTAVGFADITFSEEGAPGPGIPATGFLKVEYSGTDVCNYLQVYGEVAEITMIGQGQGVRFAISDSAQEFKYAAKNKDAEEFNIDNARGQRTTVRSKTLRLGGTGSWNDAPRDKVMKHVVENGYYDFTTGQYSNPRQEDDPILFTIEEFHRIYADGDNPEANIDMMEQHKLYKCDGTVSEVTNNRGLNANGYTYNASPYTDELESSCPDGIEIELTMSEYEALDLENLITY
jgi:hypothetical protein